MYTLGFHKVDAWRPSQELWPGSRALDSYDFPSVLTIKLACTVLHPDWYLHASVRVVKKIRVCQDGRAPHTTTTQPSLEPVVINEVELGSSKQARVSVSQERTV